MVFETRHFILDLGNEGRVKNGTGELGTVKKKNGIGEKKGTGEKGTQNHEMAWIGKKGTNELDEISEEKCYELPSEFENSSNSTWHTATVTTQTYPRGNQRLHSAYLPISVYIYIMFY